MATELEELVGFLSSPSPPVSFTLLLTLLSFMVVFPFPFPFLLM
jgi:hypothetical protein